MATQSPLRYSERYFYLSPLYANPGWYFRVRGEHSKGPFLHKEDAVRAAGDVAGACFRRRDDGGRGF